MRTLAVGAVLLLGACTSSGARPAPTTDVRTIVSTVTTTRSAPAAPTSIPPYTPAPTVHPLSPGAKPRAGEVERSCPYIKAGVDAEPTNAPNVADLEGSRVYRVTVLTRLTPVGCRFYFYSGPYEAEADIVPRTYASAAQATGVLHTIIRTGKRAESRPGFVTGVDGVRFQTRFFGPDGDDDWAFAFAKGTVLVIVHTQQTNASLNGERLARAIVGRF